MDQFNEEKEYFISKIPGYYTESGAVSPRFRGIWEAFFRSILLSVINKPFLPENISEETVDLIKKELRRRTDMRYAHRYVGEETEPAE